MNLAGLGYIAGGASQGLNDSARRQLEQLQAQLMKQQQSGQQDAGAALMQQSGVTPPAQSAVPFATPLIQKIQGLFGGGQQPQGTPAPVSALTGRGGGPTTPNQPSPTGADQGQQPQPAQGAPPPQVQAAVGKFDFPTLVNTLSKQSNMTPQRLMAALSSLAPYMNMQAQEQYKMAMLGIAKQNADTNAAYKPAMAKAALERADTGRENTDSLVKDREARSGLAREKFEASRVQFQEKMDLATNTTDTKTKTALLESARKELSALQNARNAARVTAGDDNDPTVKDLDAQIAEAKTVYEGAKKAVPSSNPEGRTTWEGKDQGRAAPIVAKPATPTSSGAMKPLPPDEISKAKLAISSGKITREQLIKALQDEGYDASGL